MHRVRRSRKKQNRKVNRKISNMAYAILIGSTIITIPTTEKIVAATGNTISVVSTPSEVTPVATSSVAMPSEVTQIATSSVATSSTATPPEGLFTNAGEIYKKAIHNCSLEQMPSPAEIYATNLLNEGVINEVEAQLIIERNFSPDNPWIAYTEEDVIYLGDLMDAEECILLSRTTRGKRALLLAGSVVCNRIGKPELGGQANVLGVINSVVSGHRQYASRTRRLVGKGAPLTHGHAFVYDWARDILTYGPIGSYRLVWQGPRQGRVYDKIGTEYFGEY